MAPWSSRSLSAHRARAESSLWASADGRQRQQLLKYIPPRPSSSGATAQYTVVAAPCCCRAERRDKNEHVRREVAGAVLHRECLLHWEHPPHLLRRPLELSSSCEPRGMVGPSWDSVMDSAWSTGVTFHTSRGKRL